MKQSVKTGRALSMPGGLLLGVMISLCITIGASVLLAKLIDLEKMKWESIGYGVMLTLLVSSFTGAMVAAKRIKHRKLFVCTLSGVAYWGSLVGITALFFGGQYEAVWVTAGLILAGSVSAALLNTENRGGKQVRNGALRSKVTKNRR